MEILPAKSSKPQLGGPSFSLRHRLTRACWGLVWFLFASWTPSPFHRWRVFLINLFGGDVHSSAHVYSSVKIWYPANLVMHENSCLAPRVDCYCMDKIILEQGVIVSQGSYLCGGSHDITNRDFQLVARPITLRRFCWIAAECFIGPGVEVGEYSVVGARGVLFRNAVSHSIFIGNPAVRVRDRVIKE